VRPRAKVTIDSQPIGSRMRNRLVVGTKMNNIDLSKVTHLCSEIVEVT